eukprot:GILK01013349.1.p1 GENE.GILK01013349.1~~GILK01013349.1.p1  ORF type:complete len:431 (+),score=74.91 GILK01013349.1:69-1361(+)
MQQRPSDMSSPTNFEDSINKKTPVHVEVCVKKTSSFSLDKVRERTLVLLQSASASYQTGPFPFSSDELLKTHVDRIVISFSGNGSVHTSVMFWQAELHIHVYQLHDDGPSEETAEGEEDLPAAQQWVLPAAEFDGLWDNLFFDSTIQNNLLEYAATGMLFSDKLVNTSVISWNRVVLLHGPPGTGKTSLCRAIAQKLSIRLAHRYAIGQLLEINAHSLFSKWFSESGKLVMKLFKKIQELVEDQDSLVCVLIDEVESLTAARKGALSGAEPSDAIRVVNALLTQIDQLRSYPNVIILTTSNITQAIDLAFVDRADIKQYIGLPSLHARYEILRSCLDELVRVGIISTKDPLLEFRRLQAAAPDAATAESLCLQQISHACEGLSGRALRKLPFQAHAFFIQAANSTLQNFLWALENAVKQELSSRQELDKM